MSKTAAYVHYAVVPSFPRLPLEHPGLSIANRRPFSRDFFNSIDPLRTVAAPDSRRSANEAGRRRSRLSPHAVQMVIETRRAITELLRPRAAVSIEGW